MYFVGLVLFIAFLIFSTLLSGSLVSFIDLASIVVVLGFSFPLLMASGLLSDFLRAFKIMGSRVNVWSMIELNKTELTLRLAMKLLLISGLSGTIIGMISIASHLSDMSALLPSIGVALLTLFYSILLVFILFPMQAKVKAMILTMDKDYNNENSTH